MLSNLPDSQTMFTAFEKKDPSFEGIFFVAVKTTGIFCRPTCPARKPKRENIRNSMSGSLTNMWAMNQHYSLIENLKIHILLSQQQNYYILVMIHFQRLRKMNTISPTNSELAKVSAM